MCSQITFKGVEILHLGHKTMVENSGVGGGGGGNLKARFVSSLIYPIHLSTAG